MASILQFAFEQYKIIILEKIDPRVRNWPFMTSPLATAILLALYVHFAKYSGPKLMEHRKPFDVKRLMIVYNLFQILMNGYLLGKSVKFIIGDFENAFCSIPVYSDSPENMIIVFANYLYFISKVMDLFDTIFMVLRKKFNQVTFLHIYHHTIMVIVAWIFTAYFPGGHAAYFGIINTFVHVIMYSYYLATSLNPEYSKSAWWKRHLTQLQLGQFVVIAIHTAILVFNPYCEFPKAVLAVLLPQPPFFFILFWDFYKNAYLKKEVKTR